MVCEMTLQSMPCFLYNLRQWHTVPLIPVCINGSGTIVITKNNFGIIIKFEYLHNASTTELIVGTVLDCPDPLLMKLIHKIRTTFIGRAKSQIVLTRDDAETFLIFPVDIMIAFMRESICS